MPLDDPFNVPASQPVAVQHKRLPGPIGQAHAEQVESKLYEAAMGIELVQTVDSPAGTTVTRSERAPDVKAALALLTTLRPDRWRDDRPIAAVQFVIHAPAVAASTADWLAQYGPGRSSTVTARPSLIVEGEAGPSVPAASGPVPDPVAVPHSPSVTRKSSSKNIKK